MRNNLPLLTVAIPTYNSAHFLHDSVGSVIRQGLSDYEIVIVDNASDDNTEDIVRSFGNDRIRYFRNETNIGSRDNFNRCLLEARGVYVKFLCADDVLLDGVVHRQLEVLETRPSVSLVTSDMLVTDSDLGERRLCRFFPGACKGSRLIRLTLSAMRNFVGGPSNILFRRKDSDGLRFDPSYRLVSDLKFNLQLMLRGDYFNLDGPGILYRRHNNSDTESNCLQEIHYPEFLRLGEEFDCWNPYTYILALRRGGAAGRRKAQRDWTRAFAPVKLSQALLGAPDMWRARRSKLGQTMAMQLSNNPQETIVHRT